MVRFSLLALFALLASFMVFGCSNDEVDPSINGDETTAPDSSNSPDMTDGDSGDDGDDETSSTGTGMTLASDVYQKDGVAICPVLDGPVADITTAEFRVVDDTTYYFC